MDWMRGLVRRMAEGEAGAGRGVEMQIDQLEQQTVKTKRAMLGSLAFGLEMTDFKLGMLEHCARVAVIAGWLGERMGLSDADGYILENAARLHEIGMISVPVEILQRSAPLTELEMALVRDQARVGAEIARAMHHPRVALLIEHQYDDYEQLREKLSIDDLLLAGVLRVADVITAISWPRPYQDPMPARSRVEVLESGAGIRFHPLAVRFAVELPTSEATGLPELPPE